MGRVGKSWYPRYPGYRGTLSKFLNNTDPHHLLMIDIFCLQFQSRKKLVSSVSWIPRNIFKITDIEEHFEQVYLKSSNTYEILCCLRFLIGD